MPALPAWGQPWLRVVEFERVRGQQDRIAARRRGHDALGRRAGLIVSGSIPLFRCGQQMRPPREHAGHSVEHLRARPPQAAVLLLLFWGRPQRGAVRQPFGVAVRDRQHTAGPTMALRRVAVGCLVAPRPQVRVVHRPAAAGALCQPNATSPASAKALSTAGPRTAARALMLARARATSLSHLAAISRDQDRLVARSGSSS